MANYQNLLNSIAAVIRTNGNQEITGAVLQSTLQSMVSVMGANATYGGVAHPTDSPGTPDGPVVYVASEMGIYTNFGAISIDANELAMLLWNPTTGTWSKESIAYIADKTEIEEVIQQGLDEIEDAKDDAISEIGQIVQNVDVTYETISGENVQLKNGGGDLLMPKTRTNNVEKYIENFVVSTTGVGTTSSFMWTDPFVTPTNLARNTDYRCRVTTDVPVPVDAPIYQALASQAKGLIATMPAGLSSYDFAWNTGNNIPNRFRVNIKKNVNWTFVVYQTSSESLEDILDNLEEKTERSVYQECMQLNNHEVIVDALCCNDKNVMQVHVGSSSSAWQNSDNYPEDNNVCSVPATCDKQGLAYALWMNSKFGNTQYRRFDWGKFSLVGDYCDDWTDDTNAFFNEQGTWNSSYGNFTEGATTTTTKVTETSPIAFDSAGYQRHIPRRYATSAGASVSFIIPAGYSRAAFIYNSHNLGDVVTITTNRANGVVKIGDNVNFADGVEANNATYDTLFTNNEDTVGVPNRMIHFKISDTSSATTITITKSSDTTKYLIYWGVAYYSTSYEPYAHLFANMAVGGYAGSAIESRKDDIIGALNPNLITYQITTINNISATSPNFTTNSNTLIGFISAINDYAESINSEIAFILQHCPKSQYDGGKIETIKDIYGRLVKYLNDNNLTLIGNLANLLEKVYRCYHSNVSINDFITSLCVDNAHFNTDGLSTWKALFTSINRN